MSWEWTLEKLRVAAPVLFPYHGDSYRENNHRENH